MFVIFFSITEYNRFEQKVHDLRERMLSTTGGGSLKTSAKRTLYVRYPMLKMLLEDVRRKD